MNWAYQLCQQPLKWMEVLTTRLFATLSMKGYTSVLPTLGNVLQMQNVYANKISSAANFLVEKARGTVILTLNVRGHLCVDT